MAGPLGLPGEWNFFQKMFGGTSNNKERLAARAYARGLSIDKYDPAKAAENKEWIAKYGYKRWGMSYVDKSSLESEASAAPTVPQSRPTSCCPPYEGQ